MSDKPAITRADGEALVDKLQKFRTTLTESEQVMLDNILLVFQDRLAQPEAEELLADFPEAEELLDEVSGFRFNVLEGSGGRPEPEAATWTTVTITTTVASHPWITCAGGGFVAQR
jgi:hypothetical protein